MKNLLAIAILFIMFAAEAVADHEQSIQPQTLDEAKAHIQKMNQLQKTGQSSCEYNAERLHYIGDTNLSLVSCLLKHKNSDYEIFRITSQGGDIDYAIWAAQLISQSGKIVEPVSFCASSCANYIITIAPELYIQAHTAISVHGGPERTSREDIVALFAQSGFGPDQPGYEEQINANLSKLNTMVDLHDAFVQDFGINPEYYNYKEPADGSFTLYDAADLISCLPKLTVISDLEQTDASNGYADQILNNQKITYLRLKNGVTQCN